MKWPTTGASRVNNPWPLRKLGAAAAVGRWKELDAAKSHSNSHNLDNNLRILLLRIFMPLNALKK